MKVEPTFNLVYRRRWGRDMVTKKAAASGGKTAVQARARRRDASAASDGKAPRTARGEKTLRKILDAARAEFGEARFFRQLDRRHHDARARSRWAHSTPISTARTRCSRRWSRHVGPGSRCGRAGDRRRQRRARRRGARAGRLFALRRRHKEVYRIIDEAEFVDPAGFRTHYVTTAERIAARLAAARARRNQRRRRARAAKCAPGR